MTRVGRGHLDDGALLGYLGGELRSWRAGTARRHLGGCELCRARSEELRSVAAAFSTYWEARKATVPAPPEEWAEIELELEVRQGRQSVWPKAVSAARRTSARHPWVIGIAVVAAAAQIWIAGGGRLRQAGPAPSREVSFAPAPTGNAPEKVIAPIPGNPSAASMGKPKVERGNLELGAIAALHRIGADVSEPVELHRSTEGLEVVATAVDAGREREIREALAPLSEIKVRFAHPERQTPALEPRVSDAPVEEHLQGVRAKLDEKLGSAAREALEGRALEQSARLLARLHAIEDLDRRFPAEVRSHFTPDESRVLDQIRADHIGQAKESLGDLQTVFDSIGAVGGVSTSQPAPAEGMLENGRRLDEAIGVVLGGAPTRKSTAELIGAASASLSSLRRELEAMR